MNDTADNPKKQQLFDDDDDDDVNDPSSKLESVKINRKYAKEYERRKLRQELRNHAYDEEDDDASSSSIEDDDAELLTTQVDVDVFKTLNALRTKDERIYDPNVRFFADSSNSSSISDEDEDVAASERKPKRLKDVVREQVIEDMEKGGAVDELDGNNNTVAPSSARFAYNAEQEAFRRDLVAASKHQGSDDDDDDMVVAPKRRLKKEEHDTNSQELSQEMEKLKANRDENDVLVDPKGEIQDGEAFLLDFFQKKPWQQQVETDDSDNDELVVPMKPPKEADDEDDDDASLEELDKTDEFEAQYNFRFEEHATSGVSHSLRNYSRHNVETFRRKDDRRRAHRLAKQERKAAERKQKEEQLKRLKNAKRQELEEKMEQIKTVAGKNGGMDEATMMQLLEGDFDEDKFAEVMESTFNDSFYEQQDEEWEDDQAVKESLKSELGTDHQIDEGAGGMYDAENGDIGKEDEDTEDMGTDDYPADEEYEDQQPEEEEQTELEQKLRSKIEDELYKLDYEDIVAGMPTRFKYRQVEANNYGLSTEEILLARDTTLKQFVSLKKMAPYAEQEYRVTGRKRRKFRDMLEDDVKEQVEEELEAQPKKKKSRRLRKGKRTRKEDSEETSKAESINELENNISGKEDQTIERESKSQAKETPSDGNDSHKLAPNRKERKKADSKVSSSGNKKKKRKRKKKKEKVEGVSNARLASYGL